MSFFGEIVVLEKVENELKEIGSIVIPKTSFFIGSNDKFCSIVIKDKRIKNTEVIMGESEVSESNNQVNNDSNSGVSINISSEGNSESNIESNSEGNSNYLTNIDNGGNSGSNEDQKESEESELKESELKKSESKQEEQKEAKHEKEEKKENIHEFEMQQQEDKLNNINNNDNNCNNNNNSDNNIQHNSIHYENLDKIHEKHLKLKVYTVGGKIEKCYITDISADGSVTIDSIINPYKMLEIELKPKVIFSIYGFSFYYSNVSTELNHDFSKHSFISISETVLTSTPSKKIPSAAIKKSNKTPIKKSLNESYDDNEENNQSTPVSIKVKKSKSNLSVSNQSLTPKKTPIKTSNISSIKKDSPSTPNKSVNTSNSNNTTPKKKLSTTTTTTTTTTQITTTTSKSPSKILSSHSERPVRFSRNSMVDFTKGNHSENPYSKRLSIP